VCSTKLGWNVKKVGKGYEQVVSSNGKTNSTQHLIRCPEEKHYTMEGSRHKQEHQGKNTKGKNTLLVCRIQSRKTVQEVPRNTSSKNQKHMKESGRSTPILDLATWHVPLACAEAHVPYLGGHDSTLALQGSLPFKSVFLCSTYEKDASGRRQMK